MAGRWETTEPRIWETWVTPCDACGQVIPRRQWRAEVEGRELRLCGPDCEELYRRYVLPGRKAG